MNSTAVVGYGWQIALSCDQNSVCVRALISVCIIRKKGSRNTDFNSERNFAEVSTRCCSLLQGISEVKVGIQRAFPSYARAN